MAVTLDAYAPFDSGAGANATEDTWRKMMRHVNGSASGVLRGIANEFQVYADSTGMQVKARTGECWLRGHWGESTVEKTMGIAAAHATLARIDRAVLRLDTVNNRIETDVLTGTAAASPAVPSLTQSSSIWETSLAKISVPAADTSIDAGQVTDDRTYTTVQVRVRQAVAQTIGNASFVKLAFDTVSAGSDNGSADLLFNTTTNTFDIGRSGLLLIVANMGWDSNTTGLRFLIIAKDGEANTDRLGESSAAANSSLFLTASAVNRFTAGDKVGIYGFQDSGANRTTNVTARAVNAAVIWLGP